MEASRESAYKRPPRVELSDAAQPGERLNVVLPHLDREQAFGGIATAMELARELARHYGDVRLVSQMELPAPERRFDLPMPEEGGGPPEQPEAVSLADGLPLACHRREIFLCTHWSTVGVWEAYSAAMERVGLRAPDFYYLIQDFEPDFLPPGPDRDRALSGYAHGERCAAVINSRELARFFHESGYRFARTYVLPPSLNPELAAYLAERGNMLSKPAPEPLVVLLYGRPGVPRNCFREALEGLILFTHRLSRAERELFVFLSAGQPHPDMKLLPGAELKSLGKLPLPVYAALLERCHLGISLMASPHPSYPPLEMALFGLKTVTNRHLGKDLAGTHPGIVSIDAPTAPDVALGLAQAVTMVPPGPVLEPAVLPSSMSPLPFAENLRNLAIEPLRAPRARQSV